MGKFSKDKGTRGERDFVNRLNGQGIKARRVPLSGAMANYKNDIILDWLGNDADAEVKIRADGFREIYKWIKPVKVLFIKANRQEGLAVVRLKDFSELLKKANSEQSALLARCSVFAPIFGPPKLMNEAA